MVNNIRTKDAKLVPIGNSRGIRITKALLQKYGLKDSILIEETKLSWEKTYKAMSNENENWDDFDTTLIDGLEGENFES